MAVVQALRKDIPVGISLEHFTRAVRPRRANQSCLAPWHDEIAALVERKYTLNQIRDFLASNGVEIGINGISIYLSRARAKAATINAIRDPHPVGEFSDAELCRRNGWGPGTVLVGANRHGTAVIRLTAVGDGNILARHIRQNGVAVSEIAGQESIWTLTKRDWRRVGSGHA